MNIRNGLEMITPETYGFIYMTHNMVNGKKYIGQKQIKSQKPWQDYLGSGKTLLKAINKYGEENFYKDILETCTNQDDLNAREEYWISYYNAVKDDTFYNICSGGRGANYWDGITDERRERLSKVHSEHAQHGEHSPFAVFTEEQVKQVIDLLLQGKTKREVSEALNIPWRTISHIRQKTTWKHLTKDVIFPEPDLTNAMRNRRRSTTNNPRKRHTAVKRRVKSVLLVPILQYDMYGKFIARYETLDDILQKYGLENRAGIVNTLNHKRNCALNSLWFYETDETITNYINNDKWLEKCRKHVAEWETRKRNHNENYTTKPIKQYDLDMNYIATYKSMGDAVKAIGGNLPHMSRALSEGNIYNGYIWEKLK